MRGANVMRIYITKRFSGKRLFLGFLGIGGTGYFTIKHIIDNLEGIERVGIIDTAYIQPIASFDGEQIRFPIEIYARGEDIFLKIDELPRGWRGNKLLKSIIKYFKAKGIEEIISVGGLTKNLQEDSSDTVRIVYNRYWNKELPYKLAPKNLRIYGPLAMVLLYSELYRIPAVSILAFSNDTMIDPMAVSKAIEVINEIFGYGVPTDELIEAAYEINKMMREIDEFSEKGGKNIYT